MRKLNACIDLSTNSLLKIIKIFLSNTTIHNFLKKKSNYDGSTHM